MVTLHKNPASVEIFLSCVLLKIILNTNWLTPKCPQSLKETSEWFISVILQTSCYSGEIFPSFWTCEAFIEHIKVFGSIKMKFSKEDFGVV